MLVYKYVCIYGVCVYMCIYTHVHMHVCVYVHTHIYTYGTCMIKAACDLSIGSIKELTFISTLHLDWSLQIH